MKANRSTSTTVSKAKLKSLAEHMVEQMNDGTLIPSNLDCEFMWYDLDRFREQWKEYLADPESYDFFYKLDAIAQENGWSPRRVASLKKSAQPTSQELLACLPVISGDDGYDFFRTAMVQDVVTDGHTVGLALIDVRGGGQGGSSFYLLGAFPTRKELDAYAQKHRMTE